MFGEVLKIYDQSYPKEWISWLPLAEFWYNANYHSAISSAPYELVYGQPPPLLSTYLPGSSVVDTVDKSFTARVVAIHMLKHHLKITQNRMKQLADKHRSDRSFEIRDLLSSNHTGSTL